jgi:hypothetical protein
VLPFALCDPFVRSEDSSQNLLDTVALIPLDPQHMKTSNQLSTGNPLEEGKCALKTAHAAQQDDER